VSRPILEKFVLILGDNHGVANGQAHRDQCDHVKPGDCITGRITVYSCAWSGPLSVSPTRAVLPFANCLERLSMAAHLNPTVAFAVTLALLSVPAAVDALPIHFRLQTTESTLDVRDDANGVQDAAGTGEVAGLLSNGARPAGMSGGGFGGAGGSLGQGAGAPAVRSGSTRRATYTSSNARWIRGSGGSGFRAGSVWNDPGLLLIATLPVVTEPISPAPPVNGRVPEPATALLLGSAVALFSIRRLRRHT
jgi:hypothetical protein